MNFKQLRAVLDLGSALVGQLGLERSNDVLGRWMAHHLARLMQEVEAADGEDRRAIEQRCVKTILDLWRHRNCLPHGSRPFEPLENVLDVIAALDPDRSSPFYGRVQLDFEDLDESDRPTPVEASPLDTAREFDHVARSLIRHLIARAVEPLANDAREWVRRAEAIEVQTPDVIAIRKLIDPDCRPSNPWQIPADIALLRSRIDELDRFAVLAKSIRDDLADRLAAAEAEVGASGRGMEKEHRPAVPRGAGE